MLLSFHLIYPQQKILYETLTMFGSVQTEVLTVAGALVTVCVCITDGFTLNS